ncbi:hypothetical protein LINGRAHAP2_LOCUS18956 [Linum grandiflorum]
MASIVYDEDRKASEENCNEGGGLEPVAKPMTEDDDDISAEEKARLARLTKLLEDCNAAEGKVWVKTDAALLRKLLVVAADPVKSDPSKSSMEGGGLEAGTKSVDSLDLSMAERRARYETKILPGGGVQIDPLLAAEIRARYEAIGKPRDWQPDPSSIAAERRARYGNMRICSERVDPSLAAESKAWFDESMQKIRQSLGFQADPGV